MKLGKIFDKAMLNESDILAQSPELKNLLVQELPAYLRKAHEDLKSDKYDVLVQDLEALARAAMKAKQLVQQVAGNEGVSGQIQRQKDKQSGDQGEMKSPHLFSIKDKQL